MDAINALISYNGKLVPVGYEFRSPPSGGMAVFASFPGDLLHDRDFLTILLASIDSNVKESFGALAYASDIILHGV